MCLLMTSAEITYQCIIMVASLDKIHIRKGYTKKLLIEPINIIIVKL